MEIEMMYIICILVLLVVFALSVFGFLVYSGLLHEINISAGKSPFGDLTIAYKVAKGAYRNAGQLFTEVINLAPSERCIGVYYDDPDQVESDNLRYIIGCILAEGSQLPNPDLQTLLQSKGYNLYNFPTSSHVVMTTFPFRNTFSVFIGIMRVYPKLSKYIKTRHLCAHPMIEIYCKDKIYFVAPLSHQDEFYVPEVLHPPIPEEPEDQPTEMDSLSDDQSLGLEESEISLEAPFTKPSAQNDHPSHDPTLKEIHKDNSDGSGSSFEELSLETS